MSLTLAVADLPTGVRLPYVEQDDPGGVPVVLLHGITDSHRCWEPVLAELPPSVHAYALTQRGHGDAGVPPSLTLDDLVADVAAFLDLTGHERAVVCGHSMGSVVAARFAVDHPGRTAALVIMGGATAFGALPLDEMTAELETITDPLDPGYLRAFQESTLARPIPAADLDRAVTESAELTAATFRAAWAAAVKSDFAADLPSIDAPTLIVFGAHDTVTSRAEQDALLAAIPGSRLVVHEDGGRAFHWEEPARFAAELAAFAGEVEA